MFSRGKIKFIYDCEIKVELKGVKELEGIKTEVKIKELSNADLDEVEDLIKSIGLYHNKALNLIAMAKKLVENFDSTVPSIIA